MTFIPSGNKYRNFKFMPGDEDDVGTNTWDCPTCTASMPPTAGAKKGDIIQCAGCGCKVEVVYPPMRIERTTIRMIEQGEEPGPHLILTFNGMRLRL